MPDHAPVPAINYQAATYLISASNLEQCPGDTALEVAFVGRSNAGKSSAINVLTDQHKLARTSKTPGRTQLFNFFTLGDERYLVDLPGFGYAKVPPALKRKWQKELGRYLEKRASLQGLVLLMDIRHPLKDLDLDIIKWSLQSGMPLHILLTKADKLKLGAAKNTLLHVQKTVGRPELISLQLFSAVSGDGVKLLRKRLDRWLIPITDGQEDVTTTDPAPNLDIDEPNAGAKVTA